jgi:hypothetical protein
MNKTRIVFGSILLLVVLSLGLAACGAQDPPPSGGSASLDGKTLVEERCTECHSLSTVTGAAKSRAAWQSTVDRMIGHGARLNNAEKEAVINYLSEAYPQ